MRTFGGRGTVLAGALVALVANGCVGLGTLDVAQLEPRMQAPPTQRVKALDLAKLGRAIDDEARIHPGDLLEVNIADLLEESRTESFPVRVDEEGMVLLPMLGAVHIGSLTEGQVEQVVRVSYQGAQLLRSPQVSVRVVEQKKHRVYVIGAVKEPGVYELPPGQCDLLNALVEAGGLAEEAGTVVEIRRRPGKLRGAGPARHALDPVPAPPSESSFEMVEYLEEPGLSGPTGASPPERGRWPQSTPLPAANRPLAANAGEVLVRLDLANEDDIRRTAAGFDLGDGDIVSVEAKPSKPFYVSGAVDAPGVFEMPPDRDVRVLEAVAMAGGVNQSSQPKHALVIRQWKEGEDPVAIHVRLDRAKKNSKHNIRLMPGDLVTVEEDVFSATRGYIRDTLRFGWNIPFLTF